MGVSYNSSEWPKINGFAWGCFTLLIGVISPLVIAGAGAHLSHPPSSSTHFYTPMLSARYGDSRIHHMDERIVWLL